MKYLGYYKREKDQKFLRYASWDIEASNSREALEKKINKFLIWDKESIEVINPFARKLKKKETSEKDVLYIMYLPPAMKENERDIWIDYRN